MEGTIAIRRQNQHISRHESYDSFRSIGLQNDGDLSAYHTGYAGRPISKLPRIDQDKSIYDSYEAPAKLNFDQRPHSSSELSEFDVENLIQLEMHSYSAVNSSFFRDLHSLVKRANHGYQEGVKPMLADGAMGGTYFIRDQHNDIMVVCKPGDEEPNSPHNPYQISSHPSGWGAAYKGKILPGFGMYREVAAYVLDSGFAGVPPTQLARVRSHLLKAEQQPLNGIYQSQPFNTVDSEYKICSVQSFVRSECSAEDMGPGKFFKDDVQRIAVMDIRLCNLDRHEGNLLVARVNPYQEHVSRMDSTGNLSGLLDDKLAMHPSEADGKFHLIPIDHGYVLPHVLHMSDPSLAWIHWPQANEPLSDSVRQYVEALDYTHDAELLRRVVGAALPETSLLTLRVCTAYLKKGVAAGLTLKELGQGMLPDYDGSSVSHSKSGLPFGHTSSLLQKAVHLAVHRALCKQYQDLQLTGRTSAHFTFPTPRSYASVLTSALTSVRSESPEPAQSAATSDKHEPSLPAALSALTRSILIAPISTTASEAGDASGSEDDNGLSPLTTAETVSPVSSATVFVDPPVKAALVPALSSSPTRSAGFIQPPCPSCTLEAIRGPPAQVRTFSTRATEDQVYTAIAGDGGARLAALLDQTLDQLVGEILGARKVNTDEVK